MRADEELLELWRMGDNSAGHELLLRYFEPVRRFFVNKVDPQDVEDLVQGAFAALVEGQHRFEGRSAFRTYLFGIAHRVLLRQIERRNRHRVEPIEDLSVIDLGTSPSSAFGRSEEQRRLLEALRRLPLRDQTVLELFYFEDLNGREIGEVLDMPENTARTCLRRAKQALAREVRRLELCVGVPESTDDDLEQWARRVRPREPDDPLNDEHTPEDA